MLKILFIVGFFLIGRDVAEVTKVFVFLRISCNMMLSFEFSPLISSVRIGFISGVDLAAVFRATIAMEVLTCDLAKTLVLT